MKQINSRHNAMVLGMMDWGIQDFVYVPSSHAAPIIRSLESQGVRAIMANREEEAVGIAGGLSLTGRKVAIIMQDNGFGNALTALATFAIQYHLAIPIFANTRGGLGEYNSMINSISEAVPSMLERIGVKVLELGISDSVEVWRSSTQAVAELARIQHRPNVTLFEALHPSLEVAQ